MINATSLWLPSGGTPPGPAAAPGLIRRDGIPLAPTRPTHLLPFVLLQLFPEAIQPELISAHSTQFHTLSCHMGKVAKGEKKPQQLSASASDGEHQDSRLGAAKAFLKATSGASRAGPRDSHHHVFSKCEVSTRDVKEVLQLLLLHAARRHGDSPPLTRFQAKPAADKAGLQARGWPNGAMAAVRQ